MAPNVLTLPPGTTSRTAQHMMALAKGARGNYRVRQLAEQITRHVAARDQLSEVLAIYHYVTSKFRYLSDPHGIELIRSPEAMLDHVQGSDCDDISTLIGALCMAVGRPVRFVTGGFQPRGGHSHVWCEALVGRQWVALDPVAGPRTRKMLGQIRTALAFY